MLKSRGFIDLIFVQEKLFRVAGLPMVDNCMSGYNSCMFAYGQVLVFYENGLLFIIINKIREGTVTLMRYLR